MSRIIVDSIRNSSASSDGITLSSDGKVTFPNTSTGKLLQVVQSIKKDVASASVSRSSDWVSHGLSVSITPSSASNKILISGRIMVSEAAGESAGINLVLYKAGSVY